VKGSRLLVNHREDWEKLPSPLAYARLRLDFLWCVLPSMWAVTTLVCFPPCFLPTLRLGFAMMLRLLFRNRSPCGICFTATLLDFSVELIIRLHFAKVKHEINYSVASAISPFRDTSFPRKTMPEIPPFPGSEITSSPGTFCDRTKAKTSAKSD
jgi:hypothetical protein